MASLEQEFQEFWAIYPRRVGKIAAFREYAKARRVASADQILDGVKRYLEHLPDDLQFVLHPRTFLHQGHWENDYSEPVRPQKPKPNPGYGKYVPFRLRETGTDGA